VKQYVIIITVFAILLFATPFVFGESAQFRTGAIRGGGDGADSDNTDESAVFEFPDKIALLLSESGEISELSVEDYIVGCLFAQIPVNYHPRALTAQAIAAHTYLLRLIRNGNIVSDNPATCQPYFCETRARALFAEDFEYENYLEIVRTAARQGARKAIFYEGEPIYAVYHSLSAGVTNTAYSVWGVDFPYLRSVDSSWDREHPDFFCTNEMSAESIRLAMFEFNRTASMPYDYEDWFTEPHVNEFGYVISYRIGSDNTKRLSGGDMWRAFRLRSTAFEISPRDSAGNTVFVINSRGFGHGVGLSQHGADILATRGFSYEEILRHYYTGIEIITVP
jgi:stage II sporulation protein D